MKKKVNVSIIIVQYKVRKILLDCIQSIVDKTNSKNYEIIVVDNDEIKTLKTALYKRFPNVIYVPNENKGFGQGNNIGAKFAKGEYLFFLNPDTELINDVISPLVSFLKHNKKTGIVAPILQHQEGGNFELQGLSTLTPLRAVAALSFINKLFPNNRLSKQYWLTGWNKSKIKEVDVVPGTAFMMTKRLYDSIGGFDENFFLYFEEFDLCKRVRDKGYEIYIAPDGKVMHLWGKSTAQRSDISAIFKKSRFYYFKKHFGIWSALLVEMFTRMSLGVLANVLFVSLALLILLYKLTSLMTFIGDQAWFYLSAKDLLLGQSFPLVGITSSHTWLHQGPLWTYLLAIALWLGNFNPVAGGYLSVGIGLLTLITLHGVSKKMLGERVAIIASLLYVTSPLVILHARMPYHTTPIPLFVLLYFFSLFQWIHGKKIYLSLSLFFLAILYNFELATVVLFAPLLIISLFGFITKQKYIKNLTRKNLYQSILFILIPMIPILIYDITHGFKQTVVFGGWLVMNALRTIGISLYESNTPQQSINIFYFTYELLQKLVFLPHGIFALLLLLISFAYVLFILYKKYTKHSIESGLLLSILWFTLTVVFYFGNKTPSEAYLPMLFPVVFLLISYFLSGVFRARALLLLVVGVIASVNIVYLLKDNYLTTNPGSLTMEIRKKAVKKIINDSNGQSYYLAGKGSGSQFESFLMPYEYLAWYADHPPTETKRARVFMLEEKGDIIGITRKL